MSRRYYFRFCEQDGSWSPWYPCSRARYEELEDCDDAKVRYEED